MIKTTTLVLQVTGFRSYVDMYLKDKVDEGGNALTVVHEVVNDRWEICLTMSEKGFQQVSFVNSIATTKVMSQRIRSFCSALLIIYICNSDRLNVGCDLHANYLIF